MKAQPYFGPFPSCKTTTAYKSANRICTSCIILSGDASLPLSKVSTLCWLPEIVSRLQEGLHLQWTGIIQAGMRQTRGKVGQLPLKAEMDTGKHQANRNYTCKQNDNCSEELREYLDITAYNPNPSTRGRTFSFDINQHLMSWLLQ